MASFLKNKKEKGSDEYNEGSSTDIVEETNSSAQKNKHIARAKRERRRTKVWKYESR
jgi:hypothetical protein